MGKLKQQQERRLNKYTGAKSKKIFCFWIFILRHGEPWEVIKFVGCFFLFFFLSFVSALQSRLEMDNFGNRQNSLEAVALIQMRNDKAELMNIVQTGNICKKVGEGP